MMKSNYNIGYHSQIGKRKALSLRDKSVVIGKRLTIGSYSIIESNVTIGDYCEIGNYCYIYSGARIDNNVKILNNSKIHKDAIIGNNSIVNGVISERVIIENNVRFFGRIAHSHRDHTLDWDTTDEASPIFKKGCFIGINSLIIGAITIGKNSYIAAGEIVRFNIPDEYVFYKNQMFPKSKFRNFIK